MKPNNPNQPAPVHSLVGRIYWKKDKRRFSTDGDRYSARYFGKSVGSVSEDRRRAAWYFVAIANGKTYNSLWKELPIDPTYASLMEAKEALESYIASVMCPPNAPDQRPASAGPLD